MSQREKKSQWALEQRRLHREANLLAAAALAGASVVTDLPAEVAEAGRELAAMEAGLRRKIGNLNVSISISIYFSSACLN